MSGWTNGDPEAAAVDVSKAKGGRKTAVKWNTSKTLTMARFIGDHLGTAFWVGLVGVCAIGLNGTASLDVAPT